MMGDMTKKIKKVEGFLVATTQEENNLRTKVVFHPVSGGVRELFTLNTEEIKTDESPVLAATGIGRRLLEWDLLKEVDSDALVVWDGSFTAQTVPEAQALQEIKCPALGLSKTTTCTADLKAFFSAKPDGCWKVTVNKEPKKVFAHLHKKAMHLFRFDVLGNADERIEELVPWSKDPIFLGYPYPLVLVDQLARVGNEERNAIRTRFQAAAGKAWSEIAEDETAINAHEILDKIQF
ncbi:DNA double-strand break repair nuclease NurA [Candidatus Woesearchaeota archaeon]|nr:DNA double-strand break repair nuclease NurA [Candidatus Woesearchaeota archaeon]